MGRLSTFAWFKAATSKHDNVEKIIDQMERHAIMSPVSQYVLDPDAIKRTDPVNIVVMDGGGMYGYANIRVFECFQKLFGKDDDWVQYFDLAGGTSVGGCGTLMMGRQGSFEGFRKDATDSLDRIRENSFAKIRLWNIFSAGSLIKEEDRLVNIFKSKYDGIPIYNPDGLKTFALCTIRNTSPEKNDKNALLSPKQKRSTAEFKPYVLRSYDIFDDVQDESKDDGGDDDDGDRNNNLLKIDGTNDVYLWEAMAATSAFPGLVSRLEVDVSGEKKNLADGFIMGNSPVAVAISEAQRLWPNRPIGVVFSTGSSDEEMPYVERVIDLVKRTHSPNLQFLRLTFDVSGFSATETDKKKIALMQKQAEKSVDMKLKELQVLAETLKKSGSRWTNKRLSKRTTNNSSSSSSGGSTRPATRFSQWKRRRTTKLNHGSTWKPSSTNTGNRFSNVRGTMVAASHWMGTTRKSSHPSMAKPNSTDNKLSQTTSMSKTALPKTNQKKNDNDGNSLGGNDYQNNDSHPSLNSTPCPELSTLRDVVQRLELLDLADDIQLDQVKEEEMMATASQFF